MNIVKVKGGMPMKNCGFGGTCKTKEKRTAITMVGAPSRIEGNRP